MAALTPALTTQAGEELWDRVVARAGTPPRDDDTFRRVLLGYAVENLAIALADEPGLARFVSDAAADEDGGWLGAQFQADLLGRQDQASLAVLFLLSQKTTSGEAGSAYFQAMSAATAWLVGATVPALTAQAAMLLKVHNDLFINFITAQRESTAALLSGITDVVLHRGDVVVAPPAQTEADPCVWPLASFAVDFATAKAFAMRKAGAVGGTPAVYSAHVPAERIVATPATGIATALEYEVVIDARNPHDLATVTLV